MFPEVLFWPVMKDRLVTDRLKLSRMEGAHPRVKRRELMQIPERGDVCHYLLNLQVIPYLDIICVNFEGYVRT